MADLTALLNEPLNPALVKVHPQSKARYLDGRHYIETANRIFGYGNWQFRITERPAKVTEGKRKSGTYYALWSVMGELQAAGATFVDLGTCEQNGEGPEAVDMASKGAVTDALKRCLRNFGDQFGLVLYDKELSYRDMADAYNAAHGDGPVEPNPAQHIDTDTGEVTESAPHAGGSSGASTTRTSSPGEHLVAKPGEVKHIADFLTSSGLTWNSGAVLRVMGVEDGHNPEESVAMWLLGSTLPGLKQAIKAAAG